MDDENHRPKRLKTTHHQEKSTFPNVNKRRVGRPPQKRISPRKRKETEMIERATTAEVNDTIWDIIDDQKQDQSDKSILDGSTVPEQEMPAKKTAPLKWLPTSTGQPQQSEKSRSTTPLTISPSKEGKKPQSSSRPEGKANTINGKPSSSVLPDLPDSANRKFDDTPMAGLGTSDSSKEDNTSNAVDTMQQTVTSESSASAKPTRPTSSPIIATEWIVVKTRSPVLRKVRWNEGKLTGKTLESTMQSITEIVEKDNIEKVRWTLITREGEYEITVAKDDEPGFENMKKAFSKEMMKTLERHQKFGQNFEFWIEPVYAETGLYDGSSGSMEEQMLPEYLM
ncbi:MAG: hypothetical protein Q9190_005447 [Brigantiaea leucoxantha]